MNRLNNTREYRNKRGFYSNAVYFHPAEKTDIYLNSEDDIVREIFQNCHVIKAS